VNRWGSVRMRRSITSPASVEQADLRAAKKAAGLCAVPTCGSKAFFPWEKCQNHVTPSVAIWGVHQEQKKARENKAREDAARGLSQS
jgi:hypothetical protein